ncbi:MAG: 4-hydroxythreonine-4-phosphate dehydrogenase PdxA [Candidatus Omnitrophota bacterium]
MFKKPKIALTLGDVSGIGPEITYKALLHHAMHKKATFVVIGTLAVLKGLKKYTKKDLPVHVLKKSSASYAFKEHCINIIDLNNISEKDYVRGVPNKKTAQAAKDFIDEAVRLARSSSVDAIVTGPIHKKSMSRIGFDFPGHTEYLAALCKIREFAMMMVSRHFKVILVTTHVPLSKIPALIKTDEVVKKIKLSHLALETYFGVRKPKIALCGLNPHAGEEGIFGLEEKKVLLPAVKKSRNENINVTGPLPSDTLFLKAYRGDYDAVVCLYHDQAMIPIKMFGFSGVVNMTLGLPFIRTSPAHGTAHDIAPMLNADESSMLAAIELAIRACNNKLRGAREV